MSVEKYERLSTEEYELIGKALFILLSECPYIPANIPVKYQTREIGRSLSLLTAESRVKKRNVQGGFTAEIDFQVAYKSFPKSNEQRIESQLLVDNIARWLENVKELPSLTNDRTITKITVSSSIPVVDSADEDGNQVYVSNAVIEYEAD